MNKLKLFTIITLFSFVLFNSTACTKEKVETKDNQAQVETTDNTQLASKNNKNARVLTISSVDKAVSGKAVNFTWMENGEKHSFAEYTKGKVVLLNFWATWCPPCRMEIPDIISLDNELPNKDFAVVAVALDNKGTLQQIQELVSGFAKSKDMPYPIFLPTQDIISPYGDINSIPTTFIIDRKGNIVEKIVGARRKADFLKSIQRAMK